MNNMFKKIASLGLCAGMILALAGCGSTGSELSAAGRLAAGTNLAEKYPEATIISLNDDTATVNGEAINEYDYTWHCDPSVAHSDVENAPAEYYTGSKADDSEIIYIDHELYYYPQLDESGFKLVRYDGEQEWAYYYNDGVNDDYIFATLPCLGNELPSQMMHTEQDAAANKVLHIKAAGTYVLSGSWEGQIKVDLGEDAFTDETAKVTLILEGVDITCTAAPGVVFENVYECDNTWEDSERTDTTIDTTNAGATVVIADGSDNYISGCNIFRMLKTKYKDENSTDEIKTQKKMRKTDGALYSYMTMNIDGGEAGDGSLTVTSSFEGIDSELHLNVRGGNITVNSQDDGMNVNEDNVSVIAFTGGNVTINAALGEEGDGVDSNGYILIDGGTISVNGVRTPDSALDSEDGVYYISGTVFVDGEEQSLESGSVTREVGGGMGGFGGRHEFNGQRPEGEKPDFADGEKPDFADGSRPERPDGERPDFAGGERPEKPSGEAPADAPQPAGESTEA